MVNEGKTYNLPVSRALTSPRSRGNADTQGRRRLEIIDRSILFTKLKCYPADSDLRDGLVHC